MKPAAHKSRWLLPALTMLVACREDAAGPPPGVDAATATADAVEDVATDPVVPGSLGQPCVVGRAGDCADGLLCLRGPTGERAGFCTRTCPRTSSGPCAGAPPGTAAYCLVTNVNAAGDKGRAFVCLVRGMTHGCPGELQCATSEEPPGSGQRLCLP